MKRKYSLELLKNTLTKEGLFNSDHSLNSKISMAMKLPSVREILDIYTPIISDLTETLGVTSTGKVYAIRMDLNTNVDNHKKFVVASLILRGVLSGYLPKTGIDTLIDGGNFNSAKALKFYCERFDMKGIYVMSKLFPEDILKLLRSKSFYIIKAPDKYAQKREVEFYEYLFELMKNSSFRKNKYCLWHAKHGGESTRWIGNDIIDILPETPKFFVACLGAGSTLEGIQIPIKEHFNSKIVIAEHSKSQLFAKIKNMPVTYMFKNQRLLHDREFRHVEGIPHMVIGPHFDQINPLLSKEAIREIDQVIVYNESDWQNVESGLISKGISTGNSSAANLACAKHLADKGNIVLTIIFEPQRPFYVQKHFFTKQHVLGACIAVGMLTIMVLRCFMPSGVQDISIISTM